MIGVSGFVSRVEQIARRKLTYRIGGVGKDGACDCIGLIMGAMYELGHKKYDMHSTNYFARYQTMEMVRADAAKPFVGQILYKAREDTDDMNARYLPGGRYYTGDLLDYYHVAVVTSTKPLRIVECTEYNGVSGIVISSSLKGWSYAGKLRGVLYEGYEETGKEETGMSTKATVKTKSGALNIREWPVDGTVIGKAPKDAVVEILAEAGDGWPKIRYDGVMGYVSKEYLSPTYVEPNEEAGEAAMPENTLDESRAVTLIDSEGNRWMPVGDFRVIFGSLD